MYNFKGVTILVISKCWNFESYIAEKTCVNTNLQKRVKRFDKMLLKYVTEWIHLKPIW